MREINSTDPAVVWNRLLKEASSSGTLILVDNLLMEREVRRKWQRYRMEFAPDIRTLESWLEELALHSLDDRDLPEVILSGSERSLWIEQWLSGHEKTEYRRFSGIKSVTAISNIIGNLYRENQYPAALYSFLKQQESGLSSASPSQKVLAELLKDYEQEIAERKWSDREPLLSRASRFNTRMIRYKKLVFYLMDQTDPHQEKALQLLSDQCKSEPPDEENDNDPSRISTNHPHSDDSRNAPDMILIRSVPVSEPEDSDEFIPVGGRLYMSVFHHPREELEQVVRQILKDMVRSENGRKAENLDNGDQKESDDVTGPSNKIVTGSSNRIPGSRYEDYVILTGDMSRYEDMVPELSRRFGVPVYASRGPSLIKHPFIRRILTYLRLDYNDFRIDDVFRVFADNRMILPELKNHDEQKTPNIRHFSQFCRAYNFRTLREATEGMSRVFESLLAQADHETDQEKRERRRASIFRDRQFYGEVTGHLEKLRSQFQTEERQSLQGWISWARNVLNLQKKDLMSREANEARQLLEVIFDQLAGSQERIGLTRDFTGQDFFRLLELRLKETRERPAEQPGGVLLTEIRQLPEVHDKIVFVLGLHEEGFPNADQADFLQFRYEKALRQLTGRNDTESYDLGRRQLVRLLSSSKPRYLSRPAHVEQKKAMPSPLWLDLEEQWRQQPGESVSGHSDNAKPPPRWPVQMSSPGEVPLLITNRDMGEWVVKQYLSPTTSGYRKKSLPATNDIPVLRMIPENRHPLCRNYLLAASVARERRLTDSMGRYDGIIDNEIIQRWWDMQGGGKRIPLSISRLDTFASSPQEFFFKYILRLQPVHEYRDDAESNIKGILLHQILQDFYSETEQEGPPVWPADDPESAHNRMERIRNRTIEEFRQQLGNPDSPFPGILIQSLTRISHWFLELERDTHPNLSEELTMLKPAVFYPDSGFEMEHRWSFEKPAGDFTVEFHGVIDRIDITPDRKRALIYDYKSGAWGVKKYGVIHRGLAYQLPVYGMYILGEGISDFMAGYYTLPVKGKKKDVKREFILGSENMLNHDSNKKPKGGRRSEFVPFKSNAKMDTFVSSILNLRIAWIARAIRSGWFHVTLTGEPAWSDFRHITRHESRIQIQRKNLERKRRKEKKMKFELDRYYLDEPFREDTPDG